MLHNTKSVYGHALVASDGEIGHVKDFYFDDKIWVIRYLVADTGSWLTGRLVLISPHAFGELDQHEKTLHVNLLKKQIQDSPPIESHKPVSRQYEVEYYRYYGWPAYWDGGAMWGFGGSPMIVPPPMEALGAQEKHHHRDDKHLQSAKSLAGYHVQTPDGAIGDVTGFLVDDKSWAIRKLVVETGHWYSGREILISTGKVERISYEQSMVFVKLTKADIQKAEANGLAEAGAVHR